MNVRTGRLADMVAAATGGWGADVVMEASGAAKAYAGIDTLLRPGGCLALIGMPVKPVPIDVSSMAAKEIRIETVFRYANVFDRALAMIASGQGEPKAFGDGDIPLRAKRCRL